MSGIAKPGLATEAVAYDPFAGGELVRVAPTTEPQREVWLADKLGRDASLAYSESGCLRLHGALDIAALHLALQTLLDRHDALRSNVGPDGETLCVRQPDKLELPVTDLSAHAPGERDALLSGHLRRAVETPFSLRDDALFRAQLLVMAPDDHVLVLTAHHIVCDGWSWWVLLRELGALYAKERGESVAALAPAESFADYALAQAGSPDTATLADDEAYWLSLYSGDVPVLDLPTDRPRPVRRSFASRREDVVFDAAMTTAIRRLGARRGASLFATLLAGFAGVISRLSGQDDVVVGIPAAGQSVDGHDGLVGHCVNLLPLRYRIAGTQSFSQFLDAAQANLLDALDHQRYTFGTLLKKLSVARDPSRLPLVSVMFNIDQALELEESAFPGLVLDFSSNARSFENFEIFVNVVQAHGELRLECQYNTGLFDAETIRRWLDAYRCLLQAAIETPEARVGDLPLVSPAQRAALAALQPPATPYDAAAGMHGRFEAQCRLTPDRIAVRHGGQAVTYAELEARANRYARLLRKHGVHRGSLVGLALERGVDMLAALLGVLKSGAGYVPLDPGFPAERLAYMVGDAGLAVLLTSTKLAGRFDLRGRPILKVDALQAEIDALPAAPLPHDDEMAGPGSTAYVIYTSGSTGQPKGVQVPHGAVANFLASMQVQPGIAANDVLVAVTTLSFDIAVLELLLPLGVGAEVVLADRETALDGRALATLIAQSGATLMQATPSTWRLLLDAGWQGDAAFRILCGGEPLPPDLAQALLSRGESLWNLYGPTETTVWSTCWRVQSPGQGMSIGTPIANTQVWILDSQGQACPLGVPGEICIGGDGVTLGYLGRPELTAERFIPDTFAQRPGATLYRTGDRGRWRPDGLLEHLGRLDFQVKVRGYRIELGEIEASLAIREDVAQALVVTREDQAGDVRIVAYVVRADGGAAALADWRDGLKQRLPEYMVPQHLVVLPALPLLPNGKIDRKALPAPVAAATEPLPRAVAPRDAFETRVLAAMSAVLARPLDDVHAGFFDLGGHSLLAAKLSARLGAELAIDVPLRTIFEAPTAAQLADVLRTLVAAPADALKAPRIVPRRQDRTTAPLSLMQQRVWFLEQLSPGRVVFNTPSAHRLLGRIDEAAFERAFAEMVRRQPSLRTVVSFDGDTALQKVLETVPVSLWPAEDLSALPDAEREARLHERLEALTAEPFDLGGAPLFRVRMFRLGDEEHVFYFMTHHLIWDGWSFDLLYQEMGGNYDALRAGRPAPFPELAVDYGDFAAWHQQWLQGEELANQLEHWKAKLAGPLTPLDLPLDRPRPAVASGNSSNDWIAIDKPLADALGEVAREAGATLFMTLLAAYVSLLHRLSGQQDIVVGVPVRNRDSAELEAVMGFFVNMLPLRVRVDPAQPFIDLVHQVRGVVMDAFACPDVPFEHLVRELGVPRDPSRQPIYQATFSFQDVRLRNRDWGDLRHKNVPIYQRASGDDLAIGFLMHDQGLSGGMLFNADVFEPATVARIRDAFTALLQSVRSDPRSPVGKLRIAASQPEVALIADTAPAVETLAVAPGLASANPTPAATGRAEVERTIAAVMAEVLRVSAVAPDDDFFAIGGHSLLAMQLNARIGRALATNLPLRWLFDYPTPRRLAAAIAQDAAATTLPARSDIVARAQQGQAPLSLMQQSLWLLEQFSTEQIALNLPAGLRLRGPVNEVALDLAFQAMVRRQAVLRTSIAPDGDALVQRVHDDCSWRLLPAEDLSRLAAPQREQQLQSRIDALVEAPFDLGQAPLFRARLYRLAADDYVLQFVAHHVVWDGWSFTLFFDELARLYDAYDTGKPGEAPALAQTYGDFSAWQRDWLATTQARAEVAHWLGVLTPLADPLELPGDRTRPVQMSGQGGSLPITITGQRVEDARALAKRHDATLFMTLLAVYVAMLHRLTGQDDLVIGIPVRGRDTVEMESVMGLFRNTLPLRIRLSPTWTFPQLLDEVRNRMLEALARPQVPFEELVHGLAAGRDFSRHPIYQALFSFQDRRDAKPAFGRLDLEVLHQYPRGATEDIGLWLDETSVGLEGAFAYNADILSPSAARRIVGRYQRLFEASLANQDVPLSALDFVTEDEDDLLATWNANEVAYPREATIHALIEAQVDRSPSRAALSFDGKVLDYAALDARANRLAHVLRARGVGRGSLVGLCLERGPDMVAAVLGVLKAGAAYVPLDPVFPRERLEYMADDAGLVLLVTTADLSSLIDWPKERRLLLDADGKEIDVAAASRLAPDAQSATSGDMAYVLYTSGSTGKPKGVMVPHGAVVNFLLSMQDRPGLTADDRLVAVTTLSFDIAALELFLPLITGAEIVLASREEAREGDALLALIDARRVTVMQATPTTWQLLLEAGWQGRPGFRALVGGESLSLDLAQNLLARCGEVWNMYGPTETTVWSTCWKVAEPEAGIWIGKPIANTTVWILDAERRPCAIGVPGEIWIGGEGVTLGYLHRPELTAERFVADPKSRRPGARLYQTGDRGRWLENGQLQHLGRLDFQVKVRGYRIELGEIDNCLLQNPAIARALAVAREDRPGDVRLVAYVVAQAGVALPPADVITHLKRSLPDYMVPQHVVVLDALPLLPNGKIDRKALPAPLASVPGDTARGVAQVSGDARVGYLMRLWSEQLGVDAGPDDNFFDLGGHSMLAVQMANRVAKETGVRIRLIRLATQTLAQIAAELPEPEAHAVAGAVGASEASWLHRMLSGCRRWFRRDGVGNE